MKKISWDVLTFHWDYERYLLEPHLQLHVNVFYHSSDEEEGKKIFLNGPSEFWGYSENIQIPSIGGFYGSKSNYHVLGFFNCHF